MIRNNNRSLLMLLVLFFLGVRSICAENILHVDTVVGRVDATAKIPVYLTNSDQVVAAQFDIQIPFNMPADGVMTLTNRTTTHQVSQTALGNNTYRVVLSSMDNTAIKGNSGIMLRIPMSVTDLGKMSYPIYISNIVLADKEGNNIATEKKSDGVFIISDDNVPNLTVSFVDVSESTLTPGGNILMEYSVDNVGKGATLAGWTAKVYLESLTTGVKTFIGSNHYAQTMKSGEYIMQELRTTLPNALKMDGKVRAAVEVIPDAGCGELIVDQDDNTGYSTKDITLDKKLFLSRYSGELYEGWRSYSWDRVVPVTLTRSGDCTTSEAFSVSSLVKGLFYINKYEYVTPTTVVIPQGSSSVNVNIYSVDDDIVRAKQDDVTFASDNGYEPVSMHIIRHDNDLNPFALSTSKEVEEGNSFYITATRGGELLDTLTTTLQCSAPQRFAEMPVITFMPGKNSVTVEVKAIDDDIPQLDRSISFWATSTDYSKATTSIYLLDNDRPSVSLTISPSVISEKAGSEASTAYVVRKGLREQAIRVRLKTSNSELFTASDYVEIPAGQDTVEVSVGINDNTNVESSAVRERTVTAAMYMPEDGCIAPSGDRANSTAVIQIVDDESPYLTLTTNAAAVGEGSSCTMYVHRIGRNNSGSLVVSLTSADKQLTVPSSVTIPSGYSYTSFSATVGKNTTEDDDRLASITATAPNYSLAQYDLRITDRTLPDATIPAEVMTDETLYSGCNTTLKAVVHNDGTQILDKGKHISFYYSSGWKRYYSTITKIYTGTISKDILIGESDTLTFTGVTLPDMTGGYYLYAQVDNDGATPQQEFSYSNNCSPMKWVKVKAPFHCSEITADKTDYLPGESIAFKGKVVADVDGIALDKLSVYVQATGNGQRTGTTVLLKADGSFQGTLDIAQSAYGTVTVDARALGQTEKSASTTVNVYNMSFYAKEGNKLDCNVDYKYTGTLVLRNLSNKDITGIDISKSVLPYGMELSFSAPTSLKAGAYVEIPYTINPTVAYASNEYSTFTLTASCKQNVSKEICFRYLCHETNCNLAFSSSEYPKRGSISELHTTLLRETSRTIAITLTNHGLKESGEISISLPEDEASSWAHLLSAATLPSLQPGQSATIRLQMIFPEGTHSGEILSTNILAAPENGSKRLLNIFTTVVGTEYSTFTLYAEDVYSINKKDFSHLNGAKVVLTDTRDSKHVISGLIGDNGTWTTDMITAGTYNMTITADRHKKVTQQFSIGPGDEQQMSVIVPYYAVVTNFQTSQDLVTNEYQMTSDINVDYNAPQAIVLPKLADNGFTCGKDTVGIEVKNVGSMTAYNPELQLANYISGISFKVLNQNDIPYSLKPGETYIMQVAYCGPDNGKRRYIGIHNMSYDFTAGEYSLNETDKYQQLMGCVSVDPENPGETVIIPPVIAVDTTRNDTSDVTPPSAMPLPSLNSSARLTYDETQHVKSGNDFMAFLEVNNGSGAAMRKFRFIPVCYDSETDDDLSELITCTEMNVNGFTKESTPGQYTLYDQTTGTMTLKYNFDASVVKNGARRILIGGQIAYFDGSIQSTQMFPLTEIILQPSGKLKAVYLVQRDYYADNKGTDTKEGAKPAEIVMLVSSEGAVGSENSDDVVIANGDLTVLSDATFKTAPYQGIYAACDGQQGVFDYFNANLGKLTDEGMHTLHFMNTAEEMAHIADMSNIAKEARLASGSIFDFEVKNVYSLVRSVSSKHNQDVSDLDETNVENIDYTVKSLAKTNAYLLDLQEDDTHTPDAVMMSDGSMAELQNVSEKAKAEGSAGTYTLNVNADSNGWIYGQINDPTNGVMVLSKVVRNSDKAVVAVADFWQTDYTVQADYSLINENLLHFADSISGTSESYTLTYVARTDDKLRVVDIKAYTAAGVEVPDGSTTNVPVTTIRISLNKNAKNIFTNNISLTIDDQLVDLTDNEGVIQKVDNSRMEYVVDLTYAKDDLGKHVFTLQTSKLKEYKTNILGEGTDTISWTEKQEMALDDINENAENNNSNIYTITGLKVKDKPTQSGIYISHGNKFIQK